MHDEEFILCHNADFLYVIDHTILPFMLYMQLIFLYNNINKTVNGPRVSLSVKRIGGQWNLAIFGMEKTISKTKQNMWFLNSLKILYTLYSSGWFNCRIFKGCNSLFKSPLWTIKSIIQPFYNQCTGFYRYPRWPRVPEH